MIWQHVLALLDSIEQVQTVLPAQSDVLHAKLLESA